MGQPSQLNRGVVSTPPPLMQWRSPAEVPVVEPIAQAQVAQQRWAAASPALGSSAVVPREDQRLARNNSGHLAAWMAGTERELRELKWLLNTSASRLDGQHNRLMSELDKLRGQLDMWGRAGGGAAGSSLGQNDEARLDVLEARFDALEQLVGREQSECAQMWQIVEVAAGAASPGDVSVGVRRPTSAPPVGRQNLSNLSGLRT